MAILHDTPAPENTEYAHRIVVHRCPVIQVPSQVHKIIVFKGSKQFLIPSDPLECEYLGFKEEAQRIQTAIAAVYREGRFLNPDQGGQASTTEKGGLPMWAKGLIAGVIVAGGVLLIIAATEDEEEDETDF